MLQHGTQCSRQRRCSFDLIYYYKVFVLGRAKLTKSQTTLFPLTATKSEMLKAVITMVTFDWLDYSSKIVKRAMKSAAGAIRRYHQESLMLALNFLSNQSGCTGVAMTNLTSTLVSERIQVRVLEIECFSKCLANSPNFRTSPGV